MHFNVARKIELGASPQSLAKDLLLDFQLMIVICVLVVATAARSEMRAGRRNAMRRCFDHRIGPGAREAGLFFRDGRLDFFSVENEGKECSFAGTAGICRKAGEAVSAIDELFDFKEQDLILTDKS